MTGGAKWWSGIVLTVVACTALATGCAGKSGGSASTSDVPQLSATQQKDAQLVDGQKVWAANCTRCHGLDGQGGVGPKLAGKVVGDFPNIADQITFVRNGKGIMPAWKNDLTKAQIRDVVRYTREGL